MVHRSHLVCQHLEHISRDALEKHQGIICRYGGSRQGGARDYLRQSGFLMNPVPVPPLTTQQAIVAEIEAEQALVAAKRELITCFEQ